MQHCNLSVDSSSHKITSAVLRDDGQIRCVVDGENHLAKNEPKNVRQIALTIDGLACLDKRGRLYRWNADPQQSKWSADESFGRASQILCLEDGSLCVTKDESAFVSEGDAWVARPDVSKWLGLAKPRRRIRFGLRSLLALVAIVALVLGPIASVRRVQQRSNAISILESQGCQIHYAHELDSSGNLIANPIEPGIDWLKPIVGPEFFFRPVQLLQYDVDAKIDASQLHHLPMLKELTIYSHAFNDLSAIRDMQQLVSLDLYRTAVEDLSPLQHLTELEILKDTVNELKQISGLKNLRKITTYADDLSLLKSFPLLEQLETSSASGLGPIPELIQLKKLDIRNGYRYSVRVHGPELSRLTELEELIVGAPNTVEDLDWTRDMKKLRVLNIQNTKPLRDVSAALMQLPNLEKLTFNRRQSLDVPLLQTHPTLKWEQIDFCSPSSNLIRDRWADLADCNLSDISFLKDYPILWHLDLSNNQIVDLEPLGKLPNLQNLKLDGNPVSDISAIDFTNLSDLSLSHTQVSDLSPLRAHGEFETLCLAGLSIGDEQLANFHAVNSLDLTGTRISNLESLRRLSEVEEDDLLLKRLWIADTLVQDLTPLKFHSELAYLDLSGTRVADLQGLKYLRYLKSLKLQGTRVRDLSPLKLLRLENLSLADTSVTDLSPLSRSTGLKVLDLSRTKIEGFSLLADFTSMRQLNLSDSAFDDLSLLPVTQNRYSLNLSGCEISKWKAADLNKMKLYDLVFSAGKMTKLNFVSEFQEVERLAINDLRSHHDLTELPLANLRVLSLSGEPMTDLSPLIMYASKLTHLQLPKGSTVSESQFSELPKLRGVYVGDELVWRDAYSFDEIRKIEFQDID